MPETLEADRIRQRMAKVRHRMDQDVSTLKENAQHLLDWRQYVAAHPTVSLGLAAVVGYFLMPSGKKAPAKVQIDRDSLQQLVEEGGIVVKQTPPPAPTMFQSAAAMASNVILRAAIAFVGQQVGKHMGREAAENTSEPYGTYSGT